MMNGLGSRKNKTTAWKCHARPTGGRLQPVLMRHTPQLSVKTRGGGGGGAELGGGGSGRESGGGSGWGLGGGSYQGSGGGGPAGGAALL